MKEIWLTSSYFNTWEKHEKGRFEAHDARSIPKRSNFYMQLFKLLMVLRQLYESGVMKEYRHWICS